MYIFHYSNKRFKSKYFSILKNGADWDIVRTGVISSKNSRQWLRLQTFSILAPLTKKNYPLKTPET